MVLGVLNHGDNIGPSNDNNISIVPNIKNFSLVKTIDLSAFAILFIS